VILREKAKPGVGEGRPWASEHNSKQQERGSVIREKRLKMGGVSLRGVA